MRRGLHRGGEPKAVLPLPDLAVPRHQIDGVAGEMPGVHGPAGAARDQLGLALTRAQAFLDPEDLGRDLDRALGQSMISRRYGVRSVRQRPGSDDARCERTR